MSTWITLCHKADLLPDTGICAQIAKQQVAIFWESQSDRLYAVSNFDPIGQAQVMSRGILGSIGQQVVVASPLYKQHFCLESGQCIEDSTYRLSTYPVRCCAGEIQLQWAADYIESNES